jgi:hypothetical protein
MTAAELQGVQKTALRAIQDQCMAGSVCYVTLTRRPLTVKAKTVSQVLTVEYVDYEHVGSLDIKRVFLARSTTRLGFQNGALTEAGINRPSSAFELSRLPLRVINAVLNVPAGFFAKIAQGFRAEADADAAAAQLINAQALLAQTRTKPTPAAPTAGTTPGTANDIGSAAAVPAPFASAFQCIGKKSASWLTGS